MPVPSTWNERELPLLEAVYLGEEAGEEMLTTEDAARAAGIDPDVAVRAMRGLYESGYVTGHEGDLSAPADSYTGLRLTERGRRTIDQWPPGPAEALIEALNRKIATTTDPDARSALEQFRDSVLSFIRDVGAQTAGTIMGNAAGGFM